MAWIITAGAVLVSAVFAWKMHRMKQDVYLFSKKLEEGLDEIAAGREFIPEEMYEDTLWGRVCEKLHRVSVVWKQKNEENRAEKEQMKELISDISHQTKTPIANLKVYLELFRDEEMEQKADGQIPLRPEEICGRANSRDFLKRMEMEANKLDFLMQSMVKMSRLETGVLRIKKERKNLFQTLRAAVAAVVPKAVKKQIQISVSCEDPLFLCHDTKWTQEALFNILDNAVKYTGQNGAVRIDVTVQEIYTKISVKDNGRGIALQRQAEIFKRFYREPEVHEQEGIGIGLYLARKITELQGGYIEVASDGKSGSDFRVYLQNQSKEP